MAATTASLQLGKPYGCLTAILDMIKVGGACVAALAEKGCEIEVMTDFEAAEWED